MGFLERFLPKEDRFAALMLYGMVIPFFRRNLAPPLMA